MTVRISRRGFVRVSLGSGLALGLGVTAARAEEGAGNLASSEVAAAPVATGRGSLPDWDGSFATGTVSDLHAPTKAAAPANAKICQARIVIASSRIYEPRLASISRGYRKSGAGGPNPARRGRNPS